MKTNDPAPCIICRGRLARAADDFCSAGCAREWARRVDCDRGLLVPVFAPEIFGRPTSGGRMRVNLQNSA